MRGLIIVACACTTASSAPAERGKAAQSENAAPRAIAQVRVGDPAASGARVGAPAASGIVKRVRIAAAVDDSVASEAPVHARLDQRVTLYVVLEVGGALYSDAPKLRAGKKTITPKPLSAAPEVTLAWHRVEPAAANYSNEAGGSFHFEPIEYQTTDIDAHGGSLVADVRPTLTPDHGNGVGTMRYRLVVTQGDHTLATPGPEARRGRGSGGLADSVFRVSIRRDDTYLGYLGEMFGQPYVWASAGTTNANHQSEHLEGSDCADFVIYGARRMGKQLDYTWTGGLPGVTKLLAAGVRTPDGVYRDANLEALPFTKVGDLVLFPRHVGVLTEDRGTIGVLDDKDLITHTLFDSPKAQAIADSGYADKPVELRRFK